MGQSKLGAKYGGEPVADFVIGDPGDLFPQASPSIYDSLDEVASKEDAFRLVIAEDRREPLRQISNFCKSRGIPFAHWSMLWSTQIDVRHLDALGISEFEDLDGNSVILKGRNKGHIVVRVGEPGVTRDNRVVLHEVSSQKRLLVILSGSSGEVSVGKDSTFVEAILTVNSHGTITVGADCMFASGIEVNQSDSHHIFDIATGKRVNPSKNIEFGNHVWVGRKAQLLPGFSIGAGSIVGACSVSSSKFGDNLIVAGNPAKVVREGIVWSRDLIKNFDHHQAYAAHDQNFRDYL